MTTLRHDWKHKEIKALFEKPFMDLLFEAHTVHRENFDPNTIQKSTLLSIKTGKCPEDCAYCPQSGHYNTGLKKEELMDLEEVIKAAQAAKTQGATRFCMGAAWKYPPKDKENKIAEMIRQVKALGLETCVTLGTLKEGQAEKLKAAGLDYYNHNIDTSREHYKKIISTRTFDERLDTLNKVRKANIKVCCGGIVGMSETPEDRINFLLELANMETHPDSVPINQLIPIKGTPLENAQAIDEIDFVRTIAVARISMPKSVVRLSAGRENMSDSLQALCFFAGANSIFYGDKLLTASNSKKCRDHILLETLGTVEAVG